MTERYRIRLDAAFLEMRERGISEISARPPIFRLLWRMGGSARPPFYATVVTNILVLSIAFTLLWLPAVFSGLPLSTLSIGPIFGVLLSLYYKLARQHYRLSVWNQSTEPIPGATS